MEIIVLCKKVLSVGLDSGLGLGLALRPTFKGLGLGLARRLKALALVLAWADEVLAWVLVLPAEVLALVLDLTLQALLTSLYKNSLQSELLRVAYAKSTSGPSLIAVAYLHNS